MRTALLIAISLTATTAWAGPRVSQNPRSGQLAEIQFERGSAGIPVGDREKVQLRLGKVAAWALENPDGYLVLDGHADREGKHAANVRLSLARAQSVQDQLIAYGINPDQIVIAAYGESPQKRRVVIWGTRAGMDAIVARTLTRGHAVVWNGVVSVADRRPTPAVAIAAERRTP